MTERHAIELVEYQPRRLPLVALEPELAEALWHSYSDQVAVETPSFKTDRQWILVSRGWIGYIPLSESVGLALRPRVPLKSVFRMLEYAYQLGDFRFPTELVECDSLEEFFESLAQILAQRVLDRVRKGVYRTYAPRHEALEYVRGRIDVRAHGRRPWEVALPCDYEEHTGDIEDNQILAWTLNRVAHSGACTERVLPAVRQAYRALQGGTTLQPFQSEVCVGRLYNRLNDDYEPSHALCRFFLEHTGPALGTGSHQVLPFLVNMARLFERFVAEWLRAHLPQELELYDQEAVPIGETWGLRFRIDMVLYERKTGRPVAVLDTKYKPEDRPATEDLEQIVAYAQAKGCQEAILVYPVVLPVRFSEPVGDIRVRSLAFALGGDLEESGQEFLATLLGIIGHGREGVSRC